jgi:hypothetical protein
MNMTICQASLLEAVLAMTQHGFAEEKSSSWRKHTIYSGERCNTAIAADFTGDGKTDVICCVGGKTLLLVAPDTDTKGNWRQIVIEGERKINAIHSGVMDVDGDGDMDFIGAQYRPGHIYWMEQPDKPLTERWRYHLVDDQILGVHGLLVGDVDGDKRPDLLANSAQPKSRFPNSLLWYRVPKNPRSAKNWHRHVFAKGDAPGLSHYLGLGDVDGDGRADGAAGAKGGPSAVPNTGDWFAWWQAPADPKGVWKKHLIADKQLGATNIHPADVNGDGKTDFIASRGHGRGVVWFEAPTWKQHTMHATLHGPHCLVVVDLDGDGDIDAATCAKDDKLCVWFENDGRGNFKTHVVGRDQAAYDIRAVDMDGDGDLDLLVAGQASKNVVWYESPVK